MLNSNDARGAAASALRPAVEFLEFRRSPQAFAYRQQPLSPLLGAGLPVQYKQFTISAYEREPGQWRARVRRANGRALIAGQGKLLEFVAATDSASEADAMTMAIEVIDAGTFSRATKRSSEKFWRRTALHKSHHR